MERKLFCSILLLAAICFPLLSIPDANSQSVATSTTMTIKIPASGQCSVLPLAFSAKKGDVIGGTFGSDVSIDLYIISQNDFNAFTQSNGCVLPANAEPVFMEQNVAGSHNTYSTVPFPKDGIYYYLFIYRNNGLAQLTNSYATINLTYPSTVTFLTSGVSSNTLETTISSPSTVSTIQTSSSIMPTITSVSTIATSTTYSTQGVQPMTNVTISHYDTFAVIQPDGTAPATVNFTVDYAGLPSGDFVLFRAVYLPSVTVVSGSATAYPVCAVLISGSAWCAVQPNLTGTVTSGSISASFDLTFNSTQREYGLEIQSAIEGATSGPNGVVTNGIVVGNSFSTSQLFKISVTQTPPASTSGFTIPGTNFTLPYSTLMSAVISVIGVLGGVAGYFIRSRKRRMVSHYLAKIDSIHNDYAVDREECRRQLQQLKREVIEKLNKGKIEESQFSLIDQRITDHLKDLAEQHVAPGTATSVSQHKGKFCSECGAHLSHEDKICHSCGSAQE